MKIKELKKKFEDGGFAENRNRDLVLEIRNSKLEQGGFLKISINAISDIRENIGFE